MRILRHVVRPRLKHGRSAVLARNKNLVRREWTKDDVRTLKALAKQKAGVAKIARMLKRSVGGMKANYFQAVRKISKYMKASN